MAPPAGRKMASPCCVIAPRRTGVRLRGCFLAWRALFRPESLAGPLGVLQGLLEVGSRTELRGLARGDLNALARLRVHALARAALGNRELAEAGDRHVASALQRLLDHLGQSVQGGLCLAPLDVGAVSQLLDQLGLVQVIPP